MPDEAVATAIGADLGALRALLAEAGLPHDDLDGGVAQLFRVDDAAGLLGYGGLELAGADALLRSVVTAPARRGTGQGAALVAALSAEAARQGVRRLWLLTTTASVFFKRIGFVAADRDRAPDAIRATGEFRDICPASATCLMREVRS